MEGLAIDWIGQNLYWSDEGLQAIYVTSLERHTAKKTLISGNMSHPRSVALDPLKGLLFWSNWNSVEDHLEISGSIRFGKNLNLILLKIFSQT